MKYHALDHTRTLPNQRRGVGTFTKRGGEAAISVTEELAQRESRVRRNAAARQRRRQARQVG